MVSANREPDFPGHACYKTNQATYSRYAGATPENLRDKPEAFSVDDEPFIVATGTVPKES